ncbi:MAG: hypothetical protein Q9222_005825 [Ikaeria aurantiellina]
MKASALDAVASAEALYEPQIAEVERQLRALARLQDLDKSELKRRQQLEDDRAGFRKGFEKTKFKAALRFTQKWGETLGGVS